MPKCINLLRLQELQLHFFENDKNIFPSYKLCLFATAV